MSSFALSSIVCVCVFAGALLGLLLRTRLPEHHLGPESKETLANLGLPPNRQPGNMGFLVHETDGRLCPPAQGGCGHIHAGEWENDAIRLRSTTTGK